MTTYEIVKTRIKNLDRNVLSYKEIEDSAPALKRQRVNEKMTYILQNPETLKWAVISDEQVEELNNLYNIVKTGYSVDEDPFLFKA